MIELQTKKGVFMKKIVLSMVAVFAVANAGMMDGALSKATGMVKEKAEKKVTEKATEMATKEAKKSLTDGSMKEKAIKKATEVADKHTDGKASQAVDAVKSFTK
jgi:pyruvoyl-dependent arginine decarboxylase (PvlArgDC)